MLTRSRVWVVLSGGGAKAAAHLGAVGELLARGYAPSHYVATSMGAVVAAALAAGLAPAAVLDRLAGIRRQEVAQVSRLALLRGWLARALLRADPLRETIARIVPVRRFADLAIPLTVTATDLDSGDRVVFGAGGEDVPLVDALYAASALPLWYPPLHLGKRRLADGGLRGPLPLGVVRAERADLVVAVDVGPGFDVAPVGPGTRPDRAPPLLQTHNDAARIMMAGLTALEVSCWRNDPARPPLVYVRPPVERATTFAVEAVARFATVGAEAMRQGLVAFSGSSA